MTLVFNGPLPYKPPRSPERRFHRLLNLPSEAKVALMLSSVLSHGGIEQAAIAIGSVPDLHLVVIGEGIRRSPRSWRRPPPSRTLTGSHFLPGSRHRTRSSPGPPRRSVSLIPRSRHRPSTTGSQPRPASSTRWALASRSWPANLPGLAEIVRETGTRGADRRDLDRRDRCGDSRNRGGAAGEAVRLARSVPGRRRAARTRGRSAVEKLLALYAELTNSGRP